MVEGKTIAKKEVSFQMGLRGDVNGTEPSLVLGYKQKNSGIKRDSARDSGEEETEGGEKRSHFA